MYYEVNEVIPFVTLHSVNGRYRRMQGIAEWEQDEDELLKEYMKIQSTVYKIDKQLKSNTNGYRAQWLRQR